MFLDITMGDGDEEWGRVWEREWVVGGGYLGMGDEKKKTNNFRLARFGNDHCDKGIIVHRASHRHGPSLE